MNTETRAFTDGEKVGCRYNDCVYKVLRYKGGGLYSVQIVGYRNGGVARHNSVYDCNESGLVKLG